MLDPMTDPVVAADGFVYDRPNIVNHLQHLPYSPVTGLMLPHRRLQVATQRRDEMAAAGLQLAAVEHDDDSTAVGVEPQAPSIAVNILHAAFKARQLRNEGAALSAEELASLETDVVQLLHDTSTLPAERLSAWVACCGVRASLPTHIAFDAMQCIVATRAGDLSYRKMHTAHLARVAKDGAPAILPFARAELKERLKLLYDRHAAQVRHFIDETEQPLPDSSDATPNTPPDDAPLPTSS